MLGTFALSTQGLVGGVLLMVNHGLVTAGFFLLIGWIYERRQTLAGQRAARPAVARRRCWPRAFTVVMLASIGLPGLNGFVSEFLVLAGHVPHPPVVGGRRPPSGWSAPRSTCCGPTSRPSTAGRPDRRRRHP